MELNTNGDSCCNCLQSKEKLISIEGNNICEKCIIKAVLMVRPIEFDKELIMRFLSYERSHQDFNGREIMTKFIDWLSPFLESKSKENNP